MSVPSNARTTIPCPARRISNLRMILFAAAVALGLSGCADDPVRPDAFRDREVGVVVNSVDLSLTVFPVDDPSESRTVGLGADGSPVTVALRDGVAAVPMGLFPAVVVVDVAEGEVIGSIGLPENSGATGAAFLNDSILLVSNPGLNSVSPVNVRAGTRGEEIATGGYPQGIVVHESDVFILNSELGEDFQPSRPGTITVLDSETLALRGTVELTGENPSGAAMAAGRLHVVNGGRWGAGDGSVAVVDPASLTEIDHVEGFGDFPGTVASGPAGRLYVTSYAYGLSVWDPWSSAFVRSPEDAVAPGGVPAVADARFDSEGRLYTLAPECETPAVVYRLSATFEEEVEIPVGICPAAIGFTQARVEG